jgi:hypothetical protein
VSNLPGMPCGCRRNMVPVSVFSEICSFLNLYFQYRFDIAM